MSYYEEITAKMQNTVNQWVTARDEAIRASKVLNKQKQDIEQLVKERQMGYPTLAKAFEEYLELQDKNIVDFLKYKKTPAIQTSVLISEVNKKRREALAEKKVLEYLVQYYESVAPFLVDLKEEVADFTEDDKVVLSDYSPEEREDEVSRYVTKEEYRRLDPDKRNQLALDRYWDRPKTKWQIGKM